MSKLIDLKGLYYFYNIIANRFSPNGHSHDDNYIQISGANGTKDGVSTLISKLSHKGTSISDSYGLINKPSTSSTYSRNTMTNLWTYIKGKMDEIYSAKSHTHNSTELKRTTATDSPTINDSLTSIETRLDELNSKTDMYTYYYDGSVNSVTSLNVLPTTRQTVVATLSGSSNTTLGFTSGSDMKVGTYLNILCICNSAVTINLVPNGTNWSCRNGNTLQVPAGEKVEINILCYQSGYYFVAIGD